MKLQPDAWVIVADGAKYMVLRNHGDKEFLDLRVVRKAEIENPPAREQATDRPGRMPDDGHGKSALKETDWHELEKRRFSSDLAAKLEEWAAKERFQKLVVIADPQTLGELRKAYGDRLDERLIAEIDKDYTNMPIDQIETALGAH